MTTAEHPTIDTALSELRTVRDAWTTMWDLHLGYGPDGQDYRPHPKASHGVERPIPVTTTRGKVESSMSRSYGASVRQLANASDNAARLSYHQPHTTPPRLEPTPRHIPIGDAHTHAVIVHDALHRTVDVLSPPWIYYRREGVPGPRRWRHDTQLDQADQIRVDAIVSVVHDSLLCIPTELWERTDLPADGPDYVTCPGAPHHPCERWIDREVTRCEECSDLAQWMLDNNPDQKQSAAWKSCPNPFSLTQHVSEITNAKRGLCGPCDQYRRRSSVA